MKIAICEDDAVYAKFLTQKIKTWAELHGCKSLLVHSYRDGESLLDQWQHGQTYDLLLLDIGLRFMDGYHLAEKIRELDQRILIVFITGSVERAMDGYRLDALRYLLKPVADENLRECLDYAYQTVQNQKERSVVFRVDGAHVGFDPRDILYLSSQEHYVVLHLLEGECRVMDRMRLDDALKMLPQEEFIRIHRLLVLNLRHITSFTSTQVTLANNEQLPIGKKYSEQVFRAFVARYLDHEWIDPGLRG